MPSKGRKAASRQAGLKSRRKRRKGGNQTFDAGPTVSSRAEREEESPAAATAAPAPVAPVVRAPRGGGRASRAAQAAAADAAAAQPYLAKEVLRIGAVTGVILVILAVASVVLG